MIRLVLYRVLLAIPQLLLVSFLTFSLLYLIPGSPAGAILGTSSNPERIAQVEAQLGLDRPFLERLGDYYAGLLQGDLGTSFITGLPVTDMFAQRLPVTLSLVAGGLVAAVVGGIVVGMIAGVKPGSVRDRVATVATAVSMAIPEFWLGIILVLVFAVQLGWVPVVAYVPITTDPLLWLRGLILPSIALGVGAAALIARQMRTSMAETMSARYVDTLTAIGVPRQRVIVRYGLKNAMVPVLAATGITVSILIGMSFVMERVFAFPGIGQLMLRSVTGKDFPVVQAGVLVIAVIVIIVNLLVDIGYGLLNPKARPQ